MTDSTPYTVNIQEAQARLPGLIEAVKRCGRPVIIARDGEPQVKITPPDAPRKKRQMGTLRDHIRIPPDFDDCRAPCRCRRRPPHKNEQPKEKP